MKIKGIIKDFLNAKHLFKEDGLEYNSKNSEKIHGMPKGIWKEITNIFRESNFPFSLNNNIKGNNLSKIETAFIAGFFCGFKQFYKKLKAEKKYRISKVTKSIVKVKPILKNKK